MSCSERPDERLMVVEVFWPVSRSVAETFTMPFESISNVTWICTSPRYPMRNPVNSNSPRSSQPSARFDSPWYTRIFTRSWPSRLVVKVFDFSMGMGVFLSMIFSVNPPTVPTRSESGVTSRR
jgi:hypothetical protein